MTFLYKALLKEQATDQAKSESNPGSNWQTDKPQWQSEKTSSGHNSSWAQDAQANPNAWAAQATNPMQWYGQSKEANSSHGWHWSAWLIVGLLLLIVGALSGYLLGVQPWQKQPFNNSHNLVGVSSQKGGSQEIGGTQDKTSDVSSSGSTVVNEANTISLSAQFEQTEDAALGNTEMADSVESEDSEPMFVAQNGQVLPEQATPSQVPTGLPQSHSLASEKNTLAVADSVQEKPITIDDYAPTNVGIDDVPDELKVAFEQAVAELEAEQGQDIEPSDNSFVVETDSTLTDINSLTEQEQAGIPQLFYQMHIYASEPASRWIKINDKTLYEGEYLNKNLKLVEIRQDIVVWETRYRRFSQVALQDYL